MDNIYIQNEAKNNFNNWTKEGLNFLLQNENYKDIAIKTLSKLLELDETVEFNYNNLHYEIFESSESGYMVNVYSCAEKDKYGCYLDKNNIYGGLCTGSSKDAIEFMM